jgi:hypothetical protein
MGLEMFRTHFDKTGQTVWSRCMGTNHSRFCTHGLYCRDSFLREAKKECENGYKDTSFYWPPYDISCVPCKNWAWCRKILLRHNAHMLRSKGKCSGCCSTARKKKPRERKKQVETLGSEGSAEAQSEDVDGLLSASSW